MNKKLKLLLAMLTVTTALGVAAACDSSSTSSSSPSDSSSSSSSSTPVANTYTVTFKADGTTVDTVTYEEGATTITAPSVPAKNGYTGAWEAYTLNNSDITVNAVYTAVTYTITFKNGTETVGTVDYTVEDTEVTEPTVAARAHYTGAWEDYDLSAGGNITVNAVYTPVTYKITFMNGTNKVSDVEYNVENYTTKTAPAVPTKEHYTGAWASYDFSSLTDQTVSVNWTPVTYTLTFKNGTETVGTVDYTVETQSITAPSVPARAHYTGAWASYDLSAGGSKDVNAVYTPVTYTITFKNGTETVEAVEYNVENYTEKAAPAVPTKTGYTGAWESYDFSSLTDQTVSVVWTGNEYKITYAANGGTLSSDEKQTVTYGEDFEFAVTATPPKSYQEFLGWQDENGNMISDDKDWLIASDATLTAVYSEGISFETLTSVPDYLNNMSSRIASFSIVYDEVKGSKVLKATSTSESTSDVGLLITKEMLDTIFADSTTEYMAFSVRTDAALTKNDSIYYYVATSSTGGTATKYQNFTSYHALRNDSYKTYYFPRSAYQSWVDNGVSSLRFFMAGGGIVKGGESIYIDDIRPVTAAEYANSAFDFEGGDLRTDNGATILYFGTNSNTGWDLSISNVQLDSNKEPIAGFTSTNVTSGNRALWFTRAAGASATGIGLNGNKNGSDEAFSTVMEEKIRAAGYISFDLYVPAGSDATMGYTTTGDIYTNAPLKAGAWTTVYVEASSDQSANTLFALSDTTGGTYIIDNIRLLSEEEYYAAGLSFETNAGVVRNGAGDPTAQDAKYYYTTADFDNSCKFTWAFSEGGANDAATVKNLRHASDVVHSGSYSLAFDKGSGYMSMSINGDAGCYSYAHLQNGFTFWIYSTVEIDGVNGVAFINGKNEKFNGGEGIKIEANTWTKVTVTKDDIKDGSRFLIMQGSFEGTIYFDDIEPLLADSTDAD